MKIKLNSVLSCALLALGISFAATPAAAYSFATSDCSINTDGWCLGGAALTQFRGAITSASNFGPGGTVSTPVTVTDLTTVNAATLAGSNAFVSTWWNNGQAAGSVSAVVSFFLGGGDLLLFQDDGGHDLIGAALGLPTLGSDGSASNGTSPLFVGPFGTATNVNEYGNTGYLDAAAIAAHNGQIGGVNGSGQAIVAYWGKGQYAPGAGKLVIVGDIDTVANVYSSPYAPLDSNGIFGLNTVAFLTAGVPEPATWSMLIAGFAAAGVAARRHRRALA